MASVHHENAHAIPHQDARTATVTRQTILAQKSLSRAAIPHKDACAATVARQTILAQNSLRHRILLRRHPVDSNNNASRCRALRRVFFSRFFFFWADQEEEADAYDLARRDLTAYRVPQAPVSNASPHRSADAPKEKAGNTPPPTRAARSLAAFMTPQAPRTGFGGVSNAAVAGGGGGGAPVPRFARDKRACAHAGRGGACCNEYEHCDGKSLQRRHAPAQTPAVGCGAARDFGAAPDDFFKRAISGMSPAKKGTRSDLQRVNRMRVRERRVKMRRRLGGGRKSGRGRRIRGGCWRIFARDGGGAEEKAGERAGGCGEKYEGRVEFQRPTFAAKESEVEQETEKEKEKPRASMLRGRAKEESTSQSRSQPVESEPETKSKTMARAQRKRKEPQEVEIVAVVSPKRRARSVKPKPVKEEEAEPPRATRKGAVPALAVAVEPGEKENAPGEENKEPAAKVRVSRTRKVKEEVVEADAAPRRTRTRTRTGDSTNMFVQHIQDHYSLVVLLNIPLLALANTPETRQFLLGVTLRIPEVRIAIPKLRK
ncbi:hypothetical protein K438DRAFT_2095507 [Mycena galopus ATCC 62051]|nr:hypothetical protein K438DRAFT_2095507 [Mycena galopus ATCC 62051]